MMQRVTFLVSALLLLILANVLMMSYSSPVFMATGEGFANYMMKEEGDSFEDASGSAVTTPEMFQDASGTEGFVSYNGQPAGAQDAYQPIGAFDGIRLTSGQKVHPWRNTAPNEKLNGYYPKFKVGPDNLFMFKDNQCKPECCGASFSCDGGCVCSTPEQRDYINMRGSNRAPGGNPDF